MIKQKMCIERQINEKQYQLFVPFDAPIDEIIAILKDMELQLDNIKKIKQEEMKNNEQS